MMLFGFLKFFLPMPWLSGRRETQVGVSQSSLDSHLRGNDSQGIKIISLILPLLLAGCQTKPVSKDDFTLQPVDFSDLPGWERDAVSEAIPALRRSCSALLKSPETKMLSQPTGGGTRADWRPFCQEVTSKTSLSDAEVRPLLVKYLKPYQISSLGKTEGMVTGYFEPELHGSRRRHGAYQTPLYRLPKPSINRSIPRHQIVKGALAGKGLEIVWVNDPIDAFFLQIQGSGRVTLDTGQVVRLGYAGTNNNSYFPVGKALIDRGELTSETVSMQTIRQWLKSHPHQAETIMSLNKSYVFFKEMKGEGPIGSQGVPLTPERSIAVDRAYTSLGIPVWLDAEHPDSGRGRIQRLLVAQDTGGAIKGALRGDLFWGYGKNAADWAGRMKSRSSEFYVLLPK